MSTELGKLQANVCHSRVVSTRVSENAVPLAFCNEPSSKFVPFFLARVDGDEKLDRNPDAFPLIFYSFELHIEIRVDFDLLALYVFYTRLESSTLIRPSFIKERLGMWPWMLLLPGDLQSRGSMEDKILNSTISIFQSFKRKKVLLLDLLFCF